MRSRLCRHPHRLPRLVISGDNGRTVKIWDAQTGHGECTLQGHTNAFRSVAFSHDGKRLFTGSGGESVRPQGIMPGAPLHHLRGWHSLQHRYLALNRNNGFPEPTGQ
jgi:WD40 repeat protein